jgi:hypothetical protein
VEKRQGESVKTRETEEVSAEGIVGRGERGQAKGEGTRR